MSGFFRPTEPAFCTARPRRRAPGGLRQGLSLIEVLLGLAIGAVLFTSLGFAIQAATGSEGMNRDFARNIQAARTTLYGITTTIRNAYEVTDVENAVVHGNSKTGNGLVVQGQIANGTVPPPVAYRWDDSKKQLAKYNNAGESGDHPNHGKGNAAAAIKSASFKALYGPDPSNKDNLVVTKVTVSLVVGDDPKNRVTLSATASPRRMAPLY